MAALSVNIDHVATVRQARRTFEPDPVWAAVDAQLGGAMGITCHLREDRRHVQDADVDRLAETVSVPFNFEMAATDEMVEIACRVRPQSAMLVPEGRAEITTEGGLDVEAQRDRLTDIVTQLSEAGIPASAFIDPEPTQIATAATCGFAVCEVHTGPWAHAWHDHGRRADSPQAREALGAVARAGRLIQEAGMRFNAGHALDYRNVQPIASLEGLCELHIGHAIVSRAVLVGMRTAVRDMVQLIEQATS